MYRRWVLSTLLVLPVMADAQKALKKLIPAPGRIIAGAADVELTRRAMAALAHGNPQVVIDTLDQGVKWHATSLHELSDGVSLDYRGAGLYLRRMAQAIAAGTHGLTVKSIELRGDAVRVDCVWSRGSETTFCRNNIQFANSKVVNVTGVA